MMNNTYQIISDSSCDLSPNTILENDITVVPFYVSFSDGKYMKEGIDISIREFYQKMIDEPENFPKSSLPSVKDYFDCFCSYAKNAVDIICMCITTKFSGSYNSACAAADMVREKYPDVRISVIDTYMDTVLQGLFVLEAARMKAAGMTYEAALKRLNELKPSGRIFFTVGSMEYLVKGGRVGKVLEAATGAFKIRPLIELKEGEIFPFGVARARTKSLKKIIDKVVKHIKKHNLSVDNYRFVVGYGYDKEEAIEFRNSFLDAIIKLPATEIPRVEIGQIGAAIGVHTGPYPLGVALIEKCVH